MKSTILPVILLSIAIALGLDSPAFSDESVTAKLFAGGDGNLNLQQAAFYIIHRDQEPLSKFMAPGQTSLDVNQTVDKMADKLDDLRTKTGHGAPWSWQELDLAFLPMKDVRNSNAISEWKKIDGISQKKVFAKGSIIESYGPLLLRNGAADISKSQADAKGATISYSKNDLNSGSGVLNSTGILDYPSLWNLYQGSNGRSVEMGVDFAGQWNIVQVRNNSQKDVEELTFSLPFTFYFSPGTISDTAGNADSASSRLWIIQGKPYFQTDFGFRHEIYGIEATTEYVGNLFASKAFYLGGYQNLGLGNWQYQLRFIPKLDYSATERSGVHTARQAGDDWLRLGSINSFDLRLGLETFKSLNVGISYQFLHAVIGDGGFSSLLKAHTTLWLLENVGLTFEYSKGHTLVANKPIDLLSLGLEFKY